MLKGVYSSSWKSVAELRSVTCHMGSRSVTCHPIHLNALRLNPSHGDWYSIYLPRRDGRLSWPWWLVIYGDGLPGCGQSPIQAWSCNHLTVTRPGVELTNNKSNRYTVIVPLLLMRCEW